MHQAASLLLVAAGVAAQSTSIGYPAPQASTAAPVRLLWMI